MNQESISLYYTQGNSDKIYEVELKRHLGGWVVNYGYGRRGSPMKTGTKTKTPVDYEVAAKAYNKLVKAKMAKGYTPAESGVTFTHNTDAGNKTRFLPQLLVEVSEAQAFDIYRNNDIILLQIKYDGERRGIMLDTDKVIPANRKGLVTSLQEQPLAACRKLLEASHTCVLDTEDMKDHLKIFDVLEAYGDDKKKDPFEIRISYLDNLKKIIEKLDLDKVLQVVDTYRPYTLKEFQDYIQNARDANEEGITIRVGTTKYIPGKPNSGGGCYKLKFIADATCRVAGVHPTKRSIKMELHDPNKYALANTRHWIFVGNCTVPANYPMPMKGDLIDVKYLYAYRNGSIYQPVYKGRRTDLDESAAVLSQLKYKKGT